MYEFWGKEEVGGIDVGGGGIATGGANGFALVVVAFARIVLLFGLL